MFLVCHCCLVVLPCHPGGGQGEVEKCYPTAIICVVLLGHCFLILWLYPPPRIKGPSWAPVTSELLLVSVDVLSLGP